MQKQERVHCVPCVKVHNGSNLTAVLQGIKRTGAKFIRLLYVAVICIFTQRHVNGNNSGIFIVISYGNGLIGILSHQNKDRKQNISVPVKVLTDAQAKTGRPHFLPAWYGNIAAPVLFSFTTNDRVRGSPSSSCDCRCFFESLV